MVTDDRGSEIGFYVSSYVEKKTEYVQKLRANWQVNRHRTS